MTSRSDRSGAGAGLELVSAALHLADVGHPVLPLAGKRPLLPHGLRQASTDTRLVAGWWREWPDANIGLRCDGLCVLDLDAPAGERSFVGLRHRFGSLPETRSQRSGAGRHLLYRATGELSQSTSPLGHPDGVHLRCGERGYIVVPPSVHRSGRRYTWINPDVPIALLPEHWLELLRRDARQPAPLAFELPSRSSAYGSAALASELERLYRVRHTRNERLNESVFRLAQLVAGGELCLAELEQAAYSAAQTLGLFDYERAKTIGTIRSAIAAGLGYPRRRKR
jgi:Bifunctional DNA primase/polymerase, N-terminal